MELAQFLTELRRQLQGQLLEDTPRITIGDFVKLTELEKEAYLQADSKEPKELRIVWITESPDTE